MGASQRQHKSDPQQKNTPEAKTNLKPGPAVSSLEWQAALDNSRVARPETILQLQRMIGNRLYITIH